MKLNSSKQYNDSKIKIIYDGECPFCTNYVGMIRLREVVGFVELVDARQHKKIVEYYKQSGYSLDEGMIVEYADEIYYGEKAMWILSVMSDGGSLINRALTMLMKRPKVAVFLYPIFRTIRYVTLKALRCPKLI